MQRPSLAMILPFLAPRRLLYFLRAWCVRHINVYLSGGFPSVFPWMELLPGRTDAGADFK